MRAQARGRSPHRRIEVFGPIRVLDDRGDEVSVGGEVARTILALLVARAGVPLSAESIIDIVWSESGTIPTRNNLRLHMSRLRKALDAGDGNDPLPSDAAGYRLAVELVNTDVGELETAVEAASKTASDTTLPELETALARRRGEPFEGARGLVELQPEIVRLNELHQTGQLLRADILASAGRPAEAVPDLEVLQERSPYSEPVAEALVRALYSAGRQHDALGVHRRFVSAVREELGLDPSPTFAALETRILNHDLATAGSQAAPVSWQISAGPDPKLGAMTSPPCFGRAEEIEWARRVVANGEHAPVALFEGEPGVGKTWLLAELSRCLAADGIPVVYGRFSGASAFGYEAWISILRALRSRLSPEQLSALPVYLAQTLARFDPGFAPAGADGPGTRTDHHALLGAVAELFDRVSCASPVVVVIDDLQWADPASDALGIFLVEQAIANLALIGAARPTPESPASSSLRAALGRRRPVRALRGLGPPDAARLLRHVRGAEAEDTLVRRVVKVSRGNPLMIRHLGRLGSGAVFADELLGSPADHVANQLVQEALAGLPAETRDLLRVAAVCGLDFDVVELSDLVGSPVESTLRWLQSGVSQGIVREHDEQRDRFEFAHATYRSELHEELTVARRERLHAQLARREPESGGDRAIRAAWHGLEAGVQLAPDELVEIGVRAADALAVRSAREHLGDLTSRLLDAQALDVARATTQLDELRLHRARALTLLGRWEDARGDYSKLAETARNAADARLLARVALEIDDYGRSVRHVGERHRLLGESHALLGGPEGLRDPLAIEVAADLVAESNQFGRGLDVNGTRQLTKLADQALTSARDVGEDGPLSAALFARAAVESWRPQTEQRLAWLTESGRLASGIGDLHRLHNATATLVVTHLSIGDLREAHNAADRHDEVAAVSRHPRVVWFAKLRTAAITQMQGDLDRAMDQYLDMYQYGAEFDLPDNEGGFGVGLFFDLYHRGRLAEARETTEEQAAKAPHNPLWRLGAGLAHAEAGDRAAALAALDQVMGHFDAYPRNEFWIAFLCVAAEVAARAAADPGLLRLLRDELQPWSGHFAVIGMMVATLGPVDRYLALLTRALGEPVDQLWRRTIALNDRVGAKVWSLRGQAETHGPSLVAR